MKLIIGNDHAGIELKKEIVAHLHEQGYIVNDVGVDTGERSDYPVIAKKVAAAISDHEYNLGILISHPALHQEQSHGYEDENSWYFPMYGGYRYSRYQSYQYSVRRSKFF